VGLFVPLTVSNPDVLRAEIARRVLAEYDDDDVHANQVTEHVRSSFRIETGSLRSPVALSNLINAAAQSLGIDDVAVGVGSPTAPGSHKKARPFLTGFHFWMTN
jgi:hypothetical protein